MHLSLGTALADGRGWSAPWDSVKPRDILDADGLAHCWGRSKPRSWHGTHGRHTMETIRGATRHRRDNGGHT
jgi:hypothetical protein